jgi:hypothetical protein
MHLSLQIYHLVSPDGDVIQQGRAAQSVVGEQFVEDAGFSDAGPQGLERSRKFRLALLINLRVRAYGEGCPGKKCGLYKKRLILAFGAIVFLPRMSVSPDQSSKLRTPPWNLFLALVHSHLMTRASL